MIQGSCLCGEVKYEIDENKIAMMSNCHCSNCRKATGADYGTFIQIPPQDFNWLSGQESVATYDSSPGNHRAFCKNCGSRMPQTNDAWPFITIPAGSLDKDPNTKPKANIFTASKVSWLSIDNSIPSVSDMGSADFWASVWPQP